MTVDAPGIPAGIPISAGAGDNAGAALGLGAHAGDVIVSIGTSGTVFAVTDAPAADATRTVAGFADASGVYLPLVATLNAARILDATAALLGVDHDELGRPRPRRPARCRRSGAAAVLRGRAHPQPPRCDGDPLRHDPRVHHARGSRARRDRGVLCGLADGLDAVRGAGVDARRILLIGGAAQNPAVAAIAAQVFDVPVVVPRPESTWRSAPPCRPPGRSMARDRSGRSTPPHPGP